MEKSTQLFLQRMRHKWKLKSTRQVLLVLAVFTLSGSSVVWLRKALFYLLGFDQSTPFWIKTFSYVVFIFPTYQCLLLLYGFLLGEFSFFWQKEKKMMAWLLRKVYG